MNKKKVLTIVLFVILLLIILFAIHTIRNFIIIRQLQENVKPYISKTNFMTKFVTQYDNNTHLTTYYYVKDGKQRLDMDRTVDGKNTKISMYKNNDGKISTFVESEDGKTATMANTSIMTITLIDYFHSDNNFETFMMSATPIITKTEYNGKEAYKIMHLFPSIPFSSNILVNVNEEAVYLDKETGLIVKYVETNSVVDREYEFDNVSDDIFVEPDISQYKLEDAR